MLQSALLKFSETGRRHRPNWANMVTNIVMDGAGGAIAATGGLGFKVQGLGFGGLGFRGLELRVRATAWELHLQSHSGPEFKL